MPSSAATLGLPALEQKTVGDRRQMAERLAQPNALTEAEQKPLLEQCLGPKSAGPRPARIVTRLLDEEGRYGIIGLRGRTRSISEV